MPLPIGDVVRKDNTGGVDGLESGRGILEGVSAWSKRSEARRDERCGRAGVSWTGGGVASWEKVAREEWTVAGEGGTVAGEEEIMAGEEETVPEEEGTAVEEEGTGVVMEAGGTVCVFVKLSMVAGRRGEVIAGFRFLFGSGGGITATAGGIGGNLLCS